ncbi:MAG: ATP-binding cassette domain-containing protein [candidate division Zixibacteria bacterium]|nr:ATP-binding cassette domain-containing protein [candidate division Zixibacteria bacterium]
MNWAIETQNLRRVFRGGTVRRLWRRKSAQNGNGETVALDAVDLQVKPGELFGLLGPNGAGKTTLLKILSTLLLPTSGTATVDGIDVAKDPERVRKRINMVSGGEHSGFGILTVRETIWMFAQFYGVPGRVVRERADRMMDILGLTEFAETKVSKLSTGTRQKMNIIRGFVSAPRILYLDEPTLGLDVAVAREVRSFVRAWVDEHPERSIILTTHYMAEADSLCDRVAIIDRGRVRACDTPANLKRDWAPECVYRIEIPLWTQGGHPLDDLDVVRSADVEHHGDRGRTNLRVILENGDGIGAVTERLSQRGVAALSVSRLEPTLEDAFLNLVGHGLAASEEKGR